MLVYNGYSVDAEGRGGGLLSLLRVPRKGGRSEKKLSSRQNHEISFMKEILTSSKNITCTWMVFYGKVQNGFLASLNIGF